MTIPQYFVFPAGVPIPAGFSQGVARGGYRASADGPLLGPASAEPADLLVYEDRSPLPAPASGEIARKLALATQDARLGIFADLEQKPDAGSIALLQALEPLLAAQDRRLLVPEAYAPHIPGAELVLDWQPSCGGFADYLAEKRARYRRPLWLDLAPVCRRVSLPWSQDQEHVLSVQELSSLLEHYDPFCFENEPLSCRCALLRDAGAWTLLLWDTAETLRKKEALAAQLGLQGVLKLWPEAAMWMDDTLSGRSCDCDSDQNSKRPFTVW